MLMRVYKYEYTLRTVNFTLSIACKIRMPKDQDVGLLKKRNPFFHASSMIPCSLHSIQNDSSI